MPNHQDDNTRKSGAAGSPDDCRQIRPVPGTPQPASTRARRLTFWEREALLQTFEQRPSPSQTTQGATRQAQRQQPGGKKRALSAHPVAQAADQWRDYAHGVSDWCAHTEQSFAGHPRAHWILEHLAIEERRVWRRYLRARFDTALPRSVVRGTDPRQLFLRLTPRLKDVLQNPIERTALRTGWVGWLLWDFACTTITHTILNTPFKGDAFAAALAAVRPILMDGLPLLVGECMLLPGAETEQEEAITLLAGYAATQLRLGSEAGTRIREALATEAGGGGVSNASLERVLWIRLPGTVLQAWDESHRVGGEPLKNAGRHGHSVMSRTVAHLEAERSEEHRLAGNARRVVPSAQLDLTASDDLSPEGLFLREEQARAVRSALAKLTSRQRLVIELFYEKDLPLTAIAARLGVEASTVRATKHQAVQKLNRVAALLAFAG